MPDSSKSLHICSITFLLPVNNKGFAIILSRGSKKAIIWKSPIGDNALYGEFVPSANYGGEVNEECEWVLSQPIVPIHCRCRVFKNAHAFVNVPPHISGKPELFRHFQNLHTSN